jgi:hypothetical protein
VTLWARLTWQAADPAALARELGSQLGISPRPGGLVGGAYLLRLGACELEVRPWVSEGPDDLPRRDGRLMLEPVPEGEDAPEASIGDPVVLHALGWATVELDRAEAELDPWLGPPAGGPRERLDPQLGARVRLRAGAGLPGTWTALAEPSTEGRTAASLARDGEGPFALYLRPAAGIDAWRARARRDAGAGRRPGAGSGAGPGGVATLAEGPFGRQALLRGGLTGPHVLVTEGRDPGDAGTTPGTMPA